MNKKKTAAFFILLANVFMLAHAVVPHHHLPNKAFIVISSLCDEHKSGHGFGHHHPQSNDEHDHSDKNNDYCTLNQFIGIPVNQAKQVFDPVKPINYHYFSGIFSAIILFTPFVFVDSYYTIKLPPSVKSSEYSCPVSGVAGLRAPPAFLFI